MKILFQIILSFTFINSLISQNVDNDEKKLTQDQYQQYFPREPQISHFTPTTDFICILPTNELDKNLQSEVNEYYKSSFIDRLPTTPNQIKRVITDKEALLEDLSNVNIYAFGTINGNLWISNFLEKIENFPIKITNDSIVAEKTYKGSNYLVTALWYNPNNFKHSVFLYIPQYLESAKIDRFILTLPQYSIWQNGKQIQSMHHYFLKNNRWHFSERRDTTLDFRDVNSLYHNPSDKIDRFHFRYPSIEQLSNCKITSNDAPYDTIRISDLKNDFSNLPDMEWLRPIAEKYKVIALGESHHLKFNSYILKRILFAANTYDYYPTLIEELPYSYTGYFNYFLSLEDDKIANAFRDSVLTKIYAPGIQTIETIRNWNKQHKNKIITVGFSDLEHNLTVTIDRILSPYLRKVGSLAVPNVDKNGDFMDFYLDEAQGVIDQAKKQNLMGEFPFQTPDYMERVLSNLLESIKINYDPKNRNDFTARYRRMVQIVTDDQFLGKQVSENKSFFYGGFEHFRTLADGSNQKAISTEGYFLAHSFEPTKGKVYSIFMNTKGISIEDSVQRIDPRLRFQQETDRIQLFKEKKIKLNEPVLGSDFSEFDNYIYRLSYKYPGYALRIRKINLDSILNKYEGFLRFMEYINIKGLQDYDTSIIIPFSPVGN